MYFGKGEESVRVFLLRDTRGTVLFSVFTSDFTLLSGDVDCTSLFTSFFTSLFTSLFTSCFLVEDRFGALFRFFRFMVAPERIFLALAVAAVWRIFVAPPRDQGVKKNFPFVILRPPPLPPPRPHPSLRPSWLGGCVVRLKGKVRGWSRGGMQGGAPGEGLTPLPGGA